MSPDAPRILLVDSYDSFTHNLAALCRRSIPNCQIRIIKNDELSIEELRPCLKDFETIIVGPGPGSPDNASDIGVVRDLWHLDDDHLLPIFGVCLGLQSLGIEFGATLGRLSTVKHGLVSQIHHPGTDIFEGVGEVNAVRYHSLHITVPPTEDIQQLAWAEDAENGRVVMAVKHTSKPFWAVQYHPESVCTQGGGWEVLRNFWTLGSQWSQTRRHTRSTIADTPSIGIPWPHTASPHSFSRPTLACTNKVLSTKVNLPQLSVTKISEYFGAADEASNCVLLDSAANPGRYSIIGSLPGDAMQVTHYVGDAFLTIIRGKVKTIESLDALDIWQWLSNYMRTRHVEHHNSSVPFWGGFVGFFSYEIGYPALHIPLQRKEKKHPDVNLTFVERSVVVDNQTGDVHIQSLIPGDDTWIAQVAEDLTNLSQSRAPNARRSSVLSLSPLSSVVLPEKQRYISRIKQAKEHLYSGDSYELCLTAQTRISIPYNQSRATPGTSTSWERYQQLRKSNPAPYSAYIRLHPSTLMSSSPERFLSFSRPPNPMCQLRPIKGTVRKGPGITRAVAEQLLAGSPKEVAENLMIVDLIRHDLHGVLGENVKTTKFCGVEEYETVWQLVSVIEGRQEKGPSKHDDFDLGWNVLKSSLPPGSMTGAPKKRSVEILQNLEDGERGVYSGVFGYWCVSGGGDWSVTIRSCFKLDQQILQKVSGVSRPEHEEWVIGAGGAITALSDPEAEWDEMILKLQSVLKSFGITPPMSA